MSTGLAVRLLAEAQRSITAATIAGSPGTYLGIGAAFANPIRILYILNGTDVQLQFSMDGISDHFVVLANGFILLDVTTNQTHTAGCFISQGQRMYVKTLGTPTTGSVFVSTFYGGNG